MQKDENQLNDTPPSPKNELKQSSVEERLQRLEDQAQRMDRLAEAIESLAASNFELIQVIMASVEVPEQEEGSGTLDG